MSTKRKTIPIRFNQTDSVLLVWRNSLNGNFSKIVKSLVYAYKNNKPYPKYTLKKIEIDEKVLSPTISGLSFSTKDIDVDLYNYVLSPECNPCVEDEYFNSIDISNKLKQIILLSMDDNIKQYINSVLDRYNLNEFVDNNKVIINDPKNVVEDGKEEKTIEIKEEVNVIKNEKIEDTKIQEDVNTNNNNDLENKEDVEVVLSKKKVDNEDTSHIDIDNKPKKKKRRSVPSPTNIPNINFSNNSMTDAIINMNKK